MMIIYNSAYKKPGNKVQAVIFDWAGTTIDYGCFAPVTAFIKSFEKYGIEPDIAEVRAPMGLPKKDHIKKIISTKRISEQWLNIHGNAPRENDINAIYDEFNRFLKESLPEHVDIKPYAIEATDNLRKAGIKIGSTTGYTKETMDMIIPGINKNGYMPDCIVTPDNLPAGRPLPWMCFRNAMDLNVYPMHNIVKVGDTASDIEEGINAGCWSVGVVRGSSEIGLTLHEEETAGENKLRERMKTAAQKFISKGAHFVIDDLSELDEVIERINDLMRGSSK